MFQYLIFLYLCRYSCLTGCLSLLAQEGNAVWHHNLFFLNTLADVSKCKHQQFKIDKKCHPGA